MRIYRDADGAFFRTQSLAIARQLSPTARVATDSDLADYWQVEELDRRTMSELVEYLGVSRQTVCNWRDRAGAFVPLLQRDVSLTIGSLLRSGASIRQVAATVQRHPATVRRIARRLEIKPRAEPRKIGDDDLVQLATGRTWAQLAEAVGRSISTLRTRIYSDPPLARRMRAVMVRGGSRAQSV